MPPPSTALSSSTKSADYTNGSVAFDMAGESGLLACQPCARDVRNIGWNLSDVHGQYSDSNTHADLYRFLNQWIDMGRYLNVGYSRLGQLHLRTDNHLRLIDRLADGLLAITPVSTNERALTLDPSPSPPRAGIMPLSPGACSSIGRGEQTDLLDIGSGRGGAALRAHSKYGLNVLGVDITAYNAQFAQANAREDAVFPNVRFVLGDAHDLPLVDGAVPRAWSIESPAHFRDKPRFLSEVARVLAIGGGFALSDLLVVEEIAMASSKNRAVYEDFLRVWDVPYLETRSSYHHAIEAAGLRLTRDEIVTRYNLDIYRRWCGLFLNLSKVPSLRNWYRDDLLRRTGADLDHVYEHVLKSHRALALGMIDYGLFWAVKPAA